MAVFNDLPIELLGDVLQHVIRRSQLSSLSLVNRSFHAFATPLLYEGVFIYPWQKDAKAKVIQLFRTLATNSQLASYVRTLEIRDFPKSLNYDDHAELTSVCTSGLLQCVNLRSCTWTRDGSISTEVLDALGELSSLEEMTINGHSGTYFDTRSLLRLTRLRTIALIMPDTSVVERVPDWVQCNTAMLRKLTLVCKASSLITDDLLNTIAPHLTLLESLHLAGCPKVTHHGVLSIIAASRHGIIDLALEGVSAMFEMEAFSEACKRTNGLSRLASITLSIPNMSAKRSSADSSVPWPDGAVGTVPLNNQQHSPRVFFPLVPEDTSWFANVLSLVSQGPLRKFHIYTSQPGAWLLPEVFVRAFVKAQGANLQRFSVHRMRISQESIELLCDSCPNLTDLYVVVRKAHLHWLGASLARAPNLRVVHINTPYEAGPEGRYVPPNDVLGVVRQCRPTITQIGCNSRVWQIERVPQQAEDGTITMEPQLRQYESPDVPEQFLVVRT